MGGIDTQVQIAIISTIGGIVVTGLTVKYKDQITGKTKDPNRMDTIFDAYEALLKQQQTDIDRKGMVIEQLQTTVDNQRLQIEKSQDLINDLREQLQDSTGQTDNLKTELNRMKKHYNSQKNGRA